MTYSNNDDACTSLVPPPGLEEFQMPKACFAANEVNSGHEGLVDPVYLPIPTGYGEWERTVLDLVPHLNDAEGVRLALGILDKAYENACMAKRLETATYAAQCQGWQTVPYGVEQARAEVAATGQLLLSALQQLQQRAGCPRSQAPSMTAVPAQSCSGLDDLPIPVPMVPSTLQPMVSAKFAPQPQVSAELAKAPAAWTEEAKQRRKPKRQMQTLSSSLQILSKEDPQCLLIVRRISKLGFKALPILKSHFSSFGNVVRVLSAHSTVRQDGTKLPHQQPRRRPSSLGFVHMASPAAVMAALAAGHEQSVQGVDILVERFEQKMETLEEVEDGTDPELWSRTTSCESAVTSTTAASSTDVLVEDEFAEDSDDQAA